MRFSFVLSSTLLLGLVGLASCSFSTSESNACESNTQCRLAFGPEQICGASGFCEVLPSTPRCEQVWPASADSEPVDVFIGVIINKSFEGHLARANAVQLAVRDANSQGGVNDMTFGLIVCTNEESPMLDNRNRVEAAVFTAEYLRSAGVAAVVGPPSSASVQAVFESVEDLLIVSPSATSVTLTDLEPAATDENPGRLWRTATPDDRQAATIVADMMSRNVTSLAIAHFDDSYGNGLSAFVDAALPSSVTRQLYSFSSNSRLADVVADIGQVEFQEILVISQTDDVLAFLRAASGNMRFNGRSFFVTDAAANSDFVQGLSANPELEPRIRGTRPEVPDAVTRDAFLARYTTTFGEDVSRQSFVANAYDAGWITLYGIAWAVLQEDSVNATTIARGLRRLSSGVEVPIRSNAWGTVINSFMSGEPVNIEGASSSLDFDPSTEELSAEFELWGVANGAIVPR